MTTYYLISKKAVGEVVCDIERTMKHITDIGINKLDHERLRGAIHKLNTGLNATSEIPEDFKEGCESRTSDTAQRARLSLTSEKGRMAHIRLVV